MLPTAFVFAILVAAQAYAAPEPRTTPVFAANSARKLVPIETAEAPAGQIVYYGLARNVTSSAAGSNMDSLTQGNNPKNQKRCGSNQVFCDTSNVPNADPCSALIYRGLQYNNNNLPTNAVALCLVTYNYGQCCISWTARPPNLPNSALFNAAAAAFGGCVVNGASGMTWDTNLGGVCCFQCLSNRPDGCATCN